jgi:hypothetical protein
MSVRRVPRVVLLSLASGVVWAATVVVLARPLVPVIWGGVLLAPFIGLAAGLAAAFFPSKGVIRRALFALASLYVAAAFFGLGMGVYDLLTGQDSGDGWRRIPSAVVIQAVTGTLWGLTFSGYVLLLWPLSYANHSIIWRVWSRPDAP